MLTGFARWPSVVVALGLSAVAGQALAADVYKGIAKFTAADGKRASVPVTISIDATTPDADRVALPARPRPTPRARRVCWQVRSSSVTSRPSAPGSDPVCNASPGGDGQIITVISDEALGSSAATRRPPSPRKAST